MAIAALVGGVFAGLSPRMKGRFGFNAGQSSLGGEFESPFAGVTPAEPDDQLELGPAPPRQELPPRTESGEG